MLHMTVLILKIIGIALLSLLGLLLLLIALVLFVPVRYRLSVDADKGVRARAQVSWLLHLLHATASYENGFGAVIRIFGIPMKRIPGAGGAGETESAAKKGRRASKKSKKEPEEQNGTAQASGSGQEQDGPAQLSENGQEPEGTAQALGSGQEQDGTAQLSENGQEQDGTAQASENEQEQDGAAQSTDPAGDDSAGKKSVFRRIGCFFAAIGRFFRAVAAFFHNLWYTIHNICDKIKGVTDRIGYVLDVIASEEGKNSIALVKRELGALLRHLCPTRLQGQLAVGMEDPAKAGQLAAIAGMLYPIYGNHISITAVFGEKSLNGTLFLKGRIRIATLLRIAWRVYFNRDMRKFLHRLKREEKA